MDVTPQQMQEIQEIEKQITLDASSGPRVLSQVEEKDRSVLINLLAALGISVVGTAAVVLLLAFPFAKKKVIVQPVVTTSTIQVSSSPNIVVQAEYVNPFSPTAQYDNPFIASQNPFSNITQ